MRDIGESLWRWVSTAKSMQISTLIWESVSRSNIRLECRCLSAKGQGQSQRRSRNQPGQLFHSDQRRPYSNLPSDPKRQPGKVGAFFWSSMDFLFGQHAEFLPACGATMFVFDFDFFDFFVASC